MAEISHPELVDGSSQANTISEAAAFGDEASLYEVGFHIVPTVDEADLAVVVGRLHTELEKIGASVVSEDIPQKIQFAYRIERSIAGKREKYTEGYFGSIRFTCPRGSAKSFEEFLRGDAQILRFLLIHTLPASAAPIPRAVFSSDRLEGEIIAKPVGPEEVSVAVSEEDIDKSIDALVN